METILMMRQTMTTITMITTGIEEACGFLGGGYYVLSKELFTKEIYYTFFH